MQYSDKLNTDTKAFKIAVKRRILRLGALALVVAAVLGRSDVVFGLIFGICIGFINVNLMFYNLARVNTSPEKARVRTFSTTIIRFVLIAGGAMAAVLKKGFNPWAVLGGFLLTYIAIISIPITEKFKSKLLTPGSKKSAQ